MKIQGRDPSTSQEMPQKKPILPTLWPWASSLHNCTKMFHYLSYTNLWYIEKQRRYFANKGPASQGYGFSCVMYGCESWTVKKAERWRIDAFKLWCWRRLLRVPWTARSNQSILKEISPGISLEGMMLKLKPVLWPPHAKSWLIGKDSDAGRDWGQEEEGTTEDEMAG